MELGARGVDATPRAIFAALWSFTDSRGRAWPSQETLARVTGRCVRTVRASVIALERAGAIVRDVPDLRERRRRRRTTAYLLRPLAPAPSPTGSPPPSSSPPRTAPSPERPREALPSPAGEALADTGHQAPELPEPVTAAPSVTAADDTAPELDGDGPSLEWEEELLPELEAFPPSPSAPTAAPSLEAFTDAPPPPPPATPTGAPEGADASAEDLRPELDGDPTAERPEPPAEDLTDTPAAPPVGASAAPSISGNGRPSTTGNPCREKTPGMNTIPAPARVRPARPSPFATPRTARAKAPPPPTSAPLAAVFARVVALARDRRAG